MPSSIERFSGPWEFLSNFYPAQLFWDGFLWPTSEHAFNGGKTLDSRERLYVLDARNPAEAKRRGRGVTLRPNWDEKVRYEVMAEVLRAKFTAHPRRVERLLSTGDALLVEGNSWHDTHWGVCSCRNHGYGDNHLGRLLMELRAELRRDREEP